MFNKPKIYFMNKKFLTKNNKINKFSKKNNLLRRKRVIISLLEEVLFIY